MMRSRVLIRFCERTSFGVRLCLCMGGIEERGAIAVSEFLAQKQGQAKANTGVLHFVQDDDVKRGHSKADFVLICVASEAKGKNK